MRLSRRSVGACIAVVALVVGLAPGALAASEDSLLAMINDERESRGLPALISHWDLADDAEAHSAAMMEADNLHHNPNLGSVTTGWVALGENVGVGPDVAAIHAAFMTSPPHRGNVLGDFTHIGIGGVRAAENELWVTVVFMKTASATTTTTTAAPPPPTSPVTAPPSTGAPPTTAVVTPAPLAPVAAVAAPAPAAVPADVSFGRVRLRHSPWPL